MGTAATSRTPGVRLSRRRIAVAGLGLVQREGVAALSMRRLAEELDTAPMSLYRHVADRRDLLDLLLDEVSDLVAPPDDDLPPREAIIATVERAHEVVDGNRWVVELMLAGDELLRPGALRLSEALYRAMARAGLEPEAAARFHAAIWQYLWGHVVVAGDLGLAQRSRAAYVAAGGDRESFPEIARVEEAVARLDPHESFRAGLLALVDGFLA
ncbi:TetR/AcrR family transcriptional regulator [Micromonospora sp. CPCC 206061]|uniref:TetR/AcrR family transcriptional regulator n=1 Tax=Micromonospora sp. CPCC 206061 TaxID=3122410 RepID=UPI002FF2B78B